MKYIKLLLAVLAVLTSVCSLIWNTDIHHITLIVLSMLTAINGWEKYQENKKDSIIFFVAAAFIGFTGIIAIL